MSTKDEQKPPYPTPYPTLWVRIETHFDKDWVYPLCRQSVLFSHIAGTKTLTANVLDLIKALGFKVEVVPTLNIELQDSSRAAAKLPKETDDDGCK